VSFEPNKIYNLCMSANSPLAKLAEKNSISYNFEFSNPAGKDGFLATNSLIGFFAVLYKTFNTLGCSLSPIIFDDNFLARLDLFINKVTPDFTFTVLYGGWGQPVAVDIESKLAEAALADVLLSDYRNFGHGRHHWFDKRAGSAAIVAIISPEEEKLAYKTLSLLPTNIPVLVIDSKACDASCSIELLIKSFYFISRLGQIQGIDPGRPGVPEFGSKLYHLNYQKFYSPTNKSVTENAKIAIARKADVPSFDSLNQKDKAFWLNAYNEFISKLKSVEFGAIVFDYDGTLCSSANRYIGIDDETAKYLNSFLKQGIIIGIATGRGKSVRENLQKVIPRKYWSQVIIGYYNCGDFGLLSENNLPNKDLTHNPTLVFIFNELKQRKFVCEIVPELKPHQIVIEIKDKSEWNKVRISIIQFIISLNQSNIQILESSHSMDIIDQTVTNKQNIIERCLKKVSGEKKATKCLCIGDKGKWPGNDYQLLSTSFSLSVDEVSAISDSCWNLSEPGVKNISATLYYLSALKFHKKGLTYTIP
jgi:hydroxymethylpyrimidine pyrophosphatase-like HAD family hydrolase